MDFRHGIEDKSWLVQVQQARLYANQAKEALEIVKVGGVTSSFQRDTYKLIFVTELCG
jgi:hypothetical protein